MADKIKIRLVRSTIGAVPKQRATVRSLGLRKIGSCVEQETTSSIQAMVKEVAHLVAIENVLSPQARIGGL